MSLKVDSIFLLSPYDTPAGNTKTPLPQHQLREGQLRMDLTAVKLDAKLCQVSPPNRWQ
nr:MAG TPA: hypothetical protein [Bacteriophage sp.]